MVQVRGDTASTSLQQIHEQAGHGDLNGSGMDHGGEHQPGAYLLEQLGNGQLLRYA